MVSSDYAQNNGWSISETAALATKAARGVGMPWGLADETGFAINWLQTSGIQGIAALCRYLHWRDTGLQALWPDNPRGNSCYCPIALGTSYMDTALPANITLKKVREPILMLPFIGKRNGERSVRVCINHLSIHVSKHGVFNPYLDTALFVSQANCKINTTADPVYIPVPDQTLRVKSCFLGCITSLQHFAKKTYAPATEESRLTGAGAGLNDND